MGRVVLVDFAEKRRRGESLRVAYLHTLDLSTTILWPAFLGLATVAGPAIRILYGTEWIAAGPLLSALSLTAILLVSITMTWELFAVCHQSHKQAKLEIVRTSIGSALFIGACFIGLNAAAFSRLADAAVSILLYRPHVEAMTETEFSDFAKVYRRNGLLTLAACAPSIILLAIWGFSPFTPIAYVAASIALGLGAWLVLLRITNHPVWTEIAHIGTKLVSRVRVGQTSQPKVVD